MLLYLAGLGVVTLVVTIVCVVASKSGASKVGEAGGAALQEACRTLVEGCSTCVARVWGPFLSWPCAILVVGMLVSSA